ncbi:MAG: IS1634 family transposase [Burkholderiaceae bacterium]|jgi:transposase|nr:IS1634 family transposase [Burkholderiaceae bacterium]
MFVKLTRSGPRTYVQLAESFRDNQGKPRQRTLATLGRLDESGGQVDAVLDALLRAKGRARGDRAAPQVRFESALALGDVWALDELWRELGFDQLAGVFRRARHTTPVEQALRVMVFNRLCDPDSKLGVLRWLQTVRVGSMRTEAITHQQLLRSMDALMDHQEAVDACVASLLRPLIDGELSLVFYDLTTIRAEGASECPEEVRRFGMSKEGGIERQFLLGVVQTADGMPIHHEVFAGNTAEAPTLMPMLTTVLGRYRHLRRLVVVADRGLLSLENIEQLSALEMPGGQPIEFILAVPGRRYADFEAILAPVQAKVAEASSEFIGEVRWQGRRLVLAHDPERAAEQGALRRSRLAALERRAQELAGKLDGQDAGKRWRGRKLSDSGAKARFFHEVCEAHLASIVRVDLKSDLFSYDVDERMLRRAELMDGKLLLVTNVEDLSAADVVARYKALADIERGFRVLKSEIEIAPVYHRMPDRIRAHASLCFLALILYRVMRSRLRLAGSDLSPEAALARLRRIQHHTISIDEAAPISGVSTVTREQSDVLAALGVRKPAKDP